MNKDAEIYAWVKTHSSLSINMADGTLSIKLGTEPNTIPSQFDAAILAVKKKFDGAHLNK